MQSDDCHLFRLKCGHLTTQKFIQYSKIKVQTTVMVVALFIISMLFLFHLIYF